jgi:chromosome partitioning protein
MNQPLQAATDKKPHVIVVGNEKGGSGKTTTSMHLIASLLDLGFKVGSIDLDARQRSLSRYLENRRQYLFKHGSQLLLPHHVVVTRSPFTFQHEAELDEEKRFKEAMEHLSDNDYIVIDCPGADFYLARLAHTIANTVITPINDSFIDLDVIAHVNAETMEMVRPSIYSEMLWEQKLERAKKGGKAMDWIVMRNRLSNLDAKNKRRMADVTERLARRIGYRPIAGFSERVIFRELFLKGLTVIDLLNGQTDIAVQMSHIAAREEVRKLLKHLKIEKISIALDARLKQDINAKKKPPVAPMAPSAKPKDAPTTTDKKNVGTSKESEASRESSAPKAESEAPSQKAAQSASDENSHVAAFKEQMKQRMQERTDSLAGQIVRKPVNA